MHSLASFLGLNKKDAQPRPSNNHNTQPTPQRDLRDTVVVAYDNRYYDVHFRDVRGGIRFATVGMLKQRCKQVTGVTIATMKLKVSGAYIKDDTATLPSSGIHEGSVVFVLGERANREQLEQTTSGNPEEAGYMTRISNLMQKVNQSREQIETLDIQVVAAIEHTLDDKGLKETEDLGIFLSEVLMQALIGLDSVECPPEFETARAKRREGVKQCQALMDRVDQSRSALKQAIQQK
ncbi:BAG family molecular chaperone regulator 1 [Choanephora cucurbitarum]|uniref:BAG family molecular chaperone regulator 1 n=1 Tax=Choanephora cucurbitarum TaxID=101091 RepID=A0A1C7N8R0_9FUNG|nr:BAG family molecular chaperone regulator 1 [Choanephora cucurbitarum]